MTFSRTAFSCTADAVGAVLPAADVKLGIDVLEDASSPSLRASASA